MPIVGTLNYTEGTTTLGATTFVSTEDGLGDIITYNASEYSHSTVFVTSATDESSFLHLNAPPLTTYYTAPTTCADRWMLAGGQVVTTRRSMDTTTRHVPAAVAPTTSSASPAATASLNDGAAPTSAVPRLQVSPIASSVISSAALLPRDFIAQNLTVLSLDLNGTATDPSYRACQPYGLAPTYSPGICPFGHTAAEITAWQVKASSGYRTFWQASCCRSGMTFGPEFREACISTFSTPLQALALLTTTTASGASATTSYELTTVLWDASARTYATSKLNSTTMLSTGLAVADPIVIAWQISDFSSFPPEYATSLAKKIGVVLPNSSGNGTGNGTREATPGAPGLSTGAKVGIGVGAALGVLTVIIATVMLCLRKRRKTKIRAAPLGYTIAEMEDQDHDHAKKKWWAGGKWRSEAAAEAEKQELDSKTVNAVPGPPAELDGAELQHPNDAGRVVFPQRDHPV